MPQLTPPGSPPRFSAASSAPKLSKPVPPRRHSIAVSSRGSTFEDRSSVFSSTPSNNQNLMASPFDSRSRTGPTCLNEQFSSFLTNVQELSSHKRTREETLRKAEEIFGPDNKDLYAILEGLITRNAR